MSWHRESIRSWYRQLSDDEEIHRHTGHLLTHYIVKDKAKKPAGTREHAAVGSAEAGSCCLLQSEELSSRSMCGHLCCGRCRANPRTSQGPTCWQGVLPPCPQKPNTEARSQTRGRPAPQAWDEATYQHSPAHQSDLDMCRMMMKYLIVFSPHIAATFAPHRARIRCLRAPSQIGFLTSDMKRPRVVSHVEHCHERDIPRIVSRITAQRTGTRR